MKVIYVDLTLLDDLAITSQLEVGLQLINSLHYFVNRGYIIKIERRPVNADPVLYGTLQQGETFDKFLNHWTKMFNNSQNGIV